VPKFLTCSYTAPFSSKIPQKGEIFSVFENKNRARNKGKCSIISLFLHLFNFCFINLSVLFMSFHLSNSGISFWNYLWALFLLLLAYLFGSILSGLIVFFCGFTSTDQLNSTLYFSLLLLPWLAVFLAFLPISKTVLKTPFIRLFTSRVRFDWRRFLWAFFLWFTLCFCTFLLTIDNGVVLNFKVTRFVSLLFVALVVLFFQCASEELLFRSFLLKWIGGQRKTIWVIQILVTGTIFGLLHATNPEVDAIGNSVMWYYIGTGIFLGLLVILDQGIELSIGFHYANNLFAAVILTNTWQVFQTDALFLDTRPPSYSSTDTLMMVGTQLIFLSACWMLFWRKQKLPFLINKKE